MSSESTPRRLRLVARAPYPEFDRSTYSIRNDLRAGRYPAYRVRGRRGIFIDIDEALAALSRLPRGTVRLGYGDLGPNGVVHDVVHTEALS